MDVKETVERRAKAVDHKWWGCSEAPPEATRKAVILGSQQEYILTCSYPNGVLTLEK